MKYLAVLLIGLTLLLTGCSSAEEKAKQKEASAKRECESRVSAFIMSTNFAKRQLRSPTTAKFPSANDRDVRTNYIGECKHEVFGYVDAQNAFGATVRTHYFAVMQNDYGTSTWRALNFEFQR